MKQVLLRMPDDVHRRLVARAVRDGLSVDALATEILDLAADVHQGDRGDRLRARAAAVGALVAALAVSNSRRQHALAAAAGSGPVLDVILAEDRDRR